MSGPISLATWLAEWRELPAEASDAAVGAGDAVVRLALHARSHERAAALHRIAALIYAISSDEVQP